MASIVLSDVCVDIPVYDATSRLLRNSVLQAATGGQIRPREGRSGRVSVRAINGLNLTLEHGARLGLVGHNGAGKSTILRVLAGIYEPTSGRIDIRGDVAAMFDLGFGMDPEASGWENILLRGMLLGLEREAVESRMDDIAEMSGLGDFLSMPMRTYSAGMATRLAFAISTSISPEILLVDEGIGAGDAAFLEQAQTRLKSFIGNAGILVMASHATPLLREWCTTGLWMEHGAARLHDDIETVLAAYAAATA